MAGGIQVSLRLWSEAGPELEEETYNATKEIGRMPDQLGKNRKHWDNLHHENPATPAARSTDSAARKKA